LIVNRKKLHIYKHYLHKEQPKVLALGSWLAKQRQLRRKGLLREDRRKLLQELVNSGKLLWYAAEGDRDEAWFRAHNTAEQFGVSRKRCRSDDYSDEEGEYGEDGDEVSRGDGEPDGRSSGSSGDDNEALRGLDVISDDEVDDEEIVDHVEYGLTSSQSNLDTVTA